MRPKVSVVIYNYNYGRYLQGAIDSALNQTYPNVEVIVLDNGSTDESPTILRGLAHNPRIKLLLRKENSLKGARFNEPLALCQGDYVAVLYADDYFLPQRIEKQVSCLESLGPDYGVIYSPCWRENYLTGERWLVPVMGCSGKIFKDILAGFPDSGYLSAVATLVRRECFERYPFLPEAYFEGEGYYLRLALRYKFQCLNEPLAVMRDHQTNLGKAIRHNASDVVAGLKRIEAEPDFPPEARTALNGLRGRKFRDYGWQGIRMLADGAWARKYIAEAVRADPKQLMHPRILAGFLLSWMPGSLLAILNSAANRLIRHREVLAVADVRGGR